MADTITDFSNPLRRSVLQDPTAGQADANDAFSLDLTAFWLLIKRNIKVLIAAVLVALLLAIVATLLTTRVYEATSTIRFEPNEAQTIQIGTQGASIGAGSSFDRQAQTQNDLVESRSMAKLVYDHARLNRNPAFLEAIGFGNSALDGGERPSPQMIEARAIDFLGSHITAESETGTELTKISFKSSSPQLAAVLANAYADAAVQQDLQHKFDSSSYARVFLTKQLKLARDRLEQSEMALNAYIAQHGLIAVQTSAEGQGGATTVISNLANSATTANEATNQRIAAQQAWEAAQNVPLMSVPQVIAAPTVQGMRAQLAAARAKLQQDRATYGDAHPAVTMDQEIVASLNTAMQAAAKEVMNGLRTQYETAQRQEQALLGRVSDLKGDAVNEGRLGVRSGILKRDVETNRSLYDALLQRQKEVSASAGINKSSVSVVDKAMVPTKPISPNLWLNLAVGLFAGLFAGLLIVLIRSQIDQRLRSPTDFSDATGLPVLGIIPKLGDGMTVAEELANPRSALSEAYFSTRTHIALSRPGGLPKTLLVTSSRESEGKSSTTYALARSIAKMGARVLIIDADLRRPSAHVFHAQVTNKLGLSELLTRNAELEAVVRHTGVDNLDIIPSGTIPPSPTELLAHSAFDAVLALAASRYDVVLVDGPPILGMADALLLASKVEAVVFVAEAERVTRSSVRHALSRLATAKPDVLGVIIGKFDAGEANEYYYYSSSYSYSSDKA